MLSISDSEIALFSDPHFGESKDNLIKMDTATNFIDKFIIENKNKIKTVFCLGDWFHNRSSINVHTNFIAYQNATKLAKHFNLYIIVGNHDTYFKHTVEVNSLKHFDNIKNVTIIEEPTEIDFNGKKGLLCPWHFNPNNYKDKHYDFLFGHFEMNGAAFVGTVSKGCEYDIKDLVELSPLVFSGHYHTRKDYDFEKGKVITIGCPYEMTWGDMLNSKGYYILNVLNNKYEFIFIK